MNGKSFAAVRWIALLLLVSWRASAGIVKP